MEDHEQGLPSAPLRESPIALTQPPTQDHGHETLRGGLGWEGELRRPSGERVGGGHAQRHAPEHGGQGTPRPPGRVGMCDAGPACSCRQDYVSDSVPTVGATREARQPAQARCNRSSSWRKRAVLSRCCSALGKPASATRRRSGSTQKTACEALALLTGGPAHERPPVGHSLSSQAVRITKGQALAVDLRPMRLSLAQELGLVAVAPELQRIHVLVPQDIRSCAQGVHREVPVRHTRSSIASAAVDGLRCVHLVQPRSPCRRQR